MGFFFFFLSDLWGAVGPTRVPVQSFWPAEEVRCHGAERFSGTSPQHAAGRQHGPRRTADLASLVLQLPWEDTVREEKLKETGLKWRAKSKG